MHARRDPEVLQFFPTKMSPQHLVTWEQNQQQKHLIRQNDHTLSIYRNEYMLPYSKIIISTKN